MERLHRISIIVDGSAQPLGLTVTTDYDTRGASHRPMAVGPFESAQEVLQRALEALEVQLTLW